MTKHNLITISLRNSLFIHRSNSSESFVELCNNFATYLNKPIEYRLSVATPFSSCFSTLTSCTKLTPFTDVPIAAAVLVAGSKKVLPSHPSKNQERKASVEVGGDAILHADVSSKSFKLPAVENKPLSKLSLGQDFLVSANEHGGKSDFSVELSPQSHGVSIPQLNSAKPVRGRNENITMRLEHRPFTTRSATSMDTIDMDKHNLNKLLHKHDMSPDLLAVPVSLTEDIVAKRNLGKNSEEIWKNIEDCRYLRGHEPKEHRLIDKLGANKYVYGITYEERHSQFLTKIARRIEETKKRRQAEAEATTYKLAPESSLNESESGYSSVDIQQYKAYMKNFF
ncbi:uncharacterized protein [Watersipora subatra]|uniref:uncharacterized protein n=1 Tax=Watersipora subatra TaxID=2589382 RepID=UPI00355C3B86